MPGDAKHFRLSAGRFPAAFCTTKFDVLGSKQHAF